MGQQKKGYKFIAYVLFCFYNIYKAFTNIHSVFGKPINANMAKNKPRYNHVF
jgi:hypothetical protein